MMDQEIALVQQQQASECNQDSILQAIHLEFDEKIDKLDNDQLDTSTSVEELFMLRRNTNTFLQVR